MIANNYSIFIDIGQNREIKIEKNTIKKGIIFNLKDILDFLRIDVNKIYSKHHRSKNYSKIGFSDFESLFKTLHHSIINYEPIIKSRLSDSDYCKLPTTCISQIGNVIVNIQSKNQYLKLLLTETFVFDGFGIIESSFNELKGVVSQIDKETKSENQPLNNRRINENIEKTNKNIKTINKVFNQILNFTNEIKSYQYNILIIIKKVTKLINEIYSKHKEKRINVDLDSITLESFNVDENKKVFLSCQESIQKNSKQSENVKIIQIISDIIEIIQKGFNENCQTDFDNFLKQQISTFFTVFLDKCKEQKNDLETLIDSYLSGFKILPNEALNQAFPEQPANLFYFTKGNFKRPASFLIKYIKSTFLLYFYYINGSQFYNILNSKTELINDRTVEFIVEIVKERKYFCFDFLFHLLIKNILNEKLISARINEITDIKLPDARYLFISDDSLNCKLYFDLQNNSFYYQRKLNKNFEIDELYSKFFVHCEFKSSENSICIPYFPLGTLHSILHGKNNKIKLNLVDKIVIILEIAMAMNDLHQVNRYQKNLCSQNIFISSTKNAYFGCFFDIDSDSSFSAIYSFGLLIYEIFTEEEISKQIKNYSINEEFIDDDGNSTYGINNLKEKCMNKEGGYSSFIEIIESIQLLPIYEKNEEEIKYRISNATHSNKYECKSSDLVESYFRGQEESKIIIQKFFKQLKTGNENETDIIQYIFKSLSLDINDESSSERYLFTLSQVEKNDFIMTNDIISSIINDFIKSLNKYLSPMIINSIYDDITKVFNKKQKLKIGELYETVLKEKKCFYLNEFTRIFIKNIVNQSLFIQAMEKIKDDFDINELILVHDIQQLNDIISSYKLYLSSILNFYIQKTYNDNVSKELQAREKRILNENYSKFIVHNNESYHKTKLTIPYFPMGTIDCIFLKPHDKSKQTLKKQNELEFNSVDKIVMILEIATALKDLHDNDEFHGCLSSQYIFLSSKKDAYIGSFCYDISLESDATRPKGPFYYRAPEFFDTPIDYSNDDEKYIDQYKLADIYSFGVLMHEILTEVNPELRMGNKPRGDRLNIVKGDYFHFLLSGRDNDCFEEGSETEELKDIIEKCMKYDSQERFSSFQEVIDNIKLLQIYLENEEEIEYRLLNAIDSRKYVCNLSDIVESYFEGQTKSKEDIYQIASNYRRNVTQDNEAYLIENTDIIKFIFENFDIKVKEDDKTYFFTDLFNIIIEDAFRNEFKPKSRIDYDDSFLLFSLEANNNKKVQHMTNYEGIVNFIVPITTLGDFIKNNDIEQYNCYLLTWIYMISKEFAIVHSNNLYVGNISTNEIGLYYSNKTKSLVPSVILFYSFHKLNQTMQTNRNDSYNMKMYSYDEILAKRQRKDIKYLHVLIHELFHFQTDFLHQINQTETANEIVYHLYNFIRKNLTSSQLEIFNKNQLSNDYSSFQITFHTLIEIFDYFKMKNFSFDNLILTFNTVFPLIDQFLTNIESNLDVPIKFNIPRMFMRTKISEMPGIIDSIRKKSSLLYSFIKNSEKEEKSHNDSLVKIEETENMIIIHAPNVEADIEKLNDIEYDALNFPENEFYTLNHSEPKKILYETKIKNLDFKEIFRYIEFAGLAKRSVAFLLKRYIFNLNPKFKYRITIKLNNQKNTANDGENTNLKLIKSATEGIPRLKKEPEAYFGNIVILINPEVKK
ncbi:hypothetical protein M9Y10_044202 [Tritrichomonas musculus]|uniref:Protein kinase domain-containing protein n=1 Tax=Tritrichomonas musculus TaxID=1915356 RepID=A0ABR2K2F8_9EUKA